MTLAYTTNGYLRINAAEIDEEFRRSNILVQAINRGIDITDRLSNQYKMNDPVAAEILDYIKDYEDICSMFSAFVYCQRQDRRCAYIVGVVVNGITDGVGDALQLCQALFIIADRM